MSNSQFCIQQRQKERQQINKLLLLGFAGSAVFHGIFAYALPRMSFESAQPEKEPMELTLIEKPKPEPKPEPKIESKPIAKPEPKPAPKPEPVQAKTPPPPPKAPEPVKAQAAPPKPVPEPPTPAPEAVPEPVPEPAPTPKEVLSTPTPAPSQPIISAPVANTVQSDSMSNSLSTASSSVAASSNNSSGGSVNGSVNGKPGGTGSVVATGNAPPRPDAGGNGEPEEGMSCVDNCEPEYPSALEGVEGSAGVKLTVDPSGNVIGAELADADSNSSVNRQALLAARQMQFSSPGDSSASVQVKIDFTVEGSEYDRLAREEQERRDRAAKERQEQEAAARQQELEAQQAQQEQLERERQAREQQQAAPPPVPEPEATPEPLPALSPEELDEERLRKFKERMENYREE